MIHAVNVPFMGKTKSITAPIARGIGHNIFCSALRAKKKRTAIKLSVMHLI